MINEIKILFFATMRDHIGERELTLSIPAESTIADLKALLAERYPGAATALDATLVAINHEYAFDHDVIPEEAEIAMFPHVSGG
jgi:molybdopterin converting factor subunit 1